MEREQAHGSCSLLFPRCSVEELWATSLWLQRGKASDGVTEQSWCPVLRLCRNREVTLSLCNNVQKCRSAQTLDFFVSESFRCKCRCCIPSVSLQLFSWAGPELSDFYFLVKVEHDGAGRMEGAGLGNMNIQCVFRLLVLFIYFCSEQKGESLYFLVSLLCLQCLCCECSLTTIPSCLA